MSLKKLKVKNKFKRPKQLDVVDILPALDVDLDEMREMVIPRQSGIPSGLSRRNMEHQFHRLVGLYAERSAMLAYHALCISYLRRRTPHTAKAWALFERLWREHADFLKRELSSKWLISALQTFFDHSPNSADRTCGGVGFTYGNMIKIYEAERNSQGLAGDIHPDRGLKAENFDGLGGFHVGSDILQNLHCVVIDAAETSKIAGPILIEFLRRSKRADIIFHRMDALAEARRDADTIKIKYAFGEKTSRL